MIPLSVELYMLKHGLTPIEKHLVREIYEVAPRIALRIAVKIKRRKNEKTLGSDRRRVG